MAPSWDWYYAGSGGFEWTNELPGSDFNDTARIRDLWSFSEAQETAGISNEMFAGFIFPYQL